MAGCMLIRRAAMLSGLAAGGVALSLGVPSRPHVTLATSIRARHHPTTVLVHGLDSSKETWAGVLNELHAAGYPAVALDLRGHGESPLGDVEDFSATALANDVLETVRALRIDKAVLVGHSMGGRVAMRAAAMDAASAEPVLASVVIEDMDLVRRDGASAIDDKQQVALAAFDRRFSSWEAAASGLLPWYSHDEGRVGSWRDGRVRRMPDGSWWSDINPVRYQPELSPSALASASASPPLSPSLRPRPQRCSRPKRRSRSGLAATECSHPRMGRRHGTHSRRSASGRVMCTCGVQTVRSRLAPCVQWMVATGASLTCAGDCQRRVCSSSRGQATAFTTHDAPSLSGHSGRWSMKRQGGCHP